MRRRRPGRKATEPKSGIAFVHVNMEVHVEPVIEPGERPTLLSRPRRAPQRPPKHLSRDGSLWVSAQVLRRSFHPARAPGTVGSSLFLTPRAHASTKGAGHWTLIVSKVFSAGSLALDCQRFASASLLQAPASPKRAARRRSPEPGGARVVLAIFGASAVAVAGARPARRVQRPLVLAPHRPCQLQPGEGYAKEPRDRQVPARGWSGGH